MPITLLTTPGGTLVLPDTANLLVSRESGGNLVVYPPREVWERSELTPVELTQWAFLVAAAGRAMLDVLPQLDGGVINYWEAGNWALNPAAKPDGAKRGRDHKRVHLHLLGRSPASADPNWRWGESPRFPDFAERLTWAAGYAPLTDGECSAVVTRATQLLRGTYGVEVAG